MKALFNSHLFKHRETSTAGFNNLCTIIHLLRTPGLYQGVAVSGDRALGSFELKCEAGAAANQVDIDVSKLDELLQKPDECCRREAAIPSYSVASNGYLVLFASGHHSCIHVTLTRITDKGREPEFDSRRLQSGDLAALRLWYPGEYELLEIGDRKAHLELRVRDAKGDRYPALHKMEAAMLTLGPEGFENKQTEVWPTQPVVIRFESPGSLELISREVRAKAAPLA